MKKVSSTKTLSRRGNVEQILVWKTVEGVQKLTKGTRINHNGLPLFQVVSKGKLEEIQMSRS